MDLDRPFRSSVGASPPKPRNLLSRDKIVHAACVVLARDGYDTLAMRSVAAELGVEAPALYRHVESREELIDLLFDHLMADCAPVLAGRDWREDLRTVAKAWWRRLTTTRDATRIALDQVSIGPNLAPLLEAALSALRGSGLSDRDLIEAYQACIVVVHGSASAQASHPGLEARPDGMGPRYTPLNPEWMARYHRLAGLAEQLAGPADFEARFDFALDALVAGIEKRLAPH
jgi:TetR/AcrR family tetracycline transcriptional repressor